MTVRHFMGPSYCPDCSREYDPVTGLCRACDPNLYRVAGFTQAWLDGDEETALGETVSRRFVGASVQEKLDLGCDLITIQMLRE